MQTQQSLSAYAPIDGRNLREAYDTAVRLVKENLSEFTDCFPDSNSKDGFYPKSPNIEWTTGFWTGEIWLAYEAVKDMSLIHIFKSFNQGRASAIGVMMFLITFLISLIPFRLFRGKE